MSETIHVTLGCYEQRHHDCDFADDDCDFADDAGWCQCDCHMGGVR